MTEVLGSANLSVKAVPERTPDHQQPDRTSCGFYILAFIEEDYRWLRGEGIFRVSENWGQKASELNKWNTNVLTAQKKLKRKRKG